MDERLLILEYAKLILSPQVVTGIVVVIVFVVLRNAIRALLSRIASIRFPGGEVLTARQEQQSSERLPKQAAPVPSAPEAAPVALKEPGPTNQAAPVPSAPEAAPVELTEQQSKDIQSLITSEKLNARLWEYRYLNYYLVFRTQAVLTWLASREQPITKSLLDSDLMAYIPEAGERAAICRALETHHLIESRGDLVEITPKGREYVDWRGPLQPPPTPPATSAVPS